MASNVRDLLKPRTITAPQHDRIVAALTKFRGSHVFHVFVKMYVVNVSFEVPSFEVTRFFEDLVTTLRDCGIPVAHEGISVNPLEPLPPSMTFVISGSTGPLANVLRRKLREERVISPLDTIRVEHPKSATARIVVNGKPVDTSDFLEIRIGSKYFVGRP